ncbi:ABC transporter substrate-binding protein [Priestia taiwanensis]|nr:ABC transporter substrate-binding protein [Priestia taiwanensis]
MLVVVMMMTLVFAACGKKESEEASTSAKEEKKTAEIKVKDFTDREIVFKEHPKNIAALSSGDVDIIHALGGTIVGRPSSKVPLASEELEKATQIGNLHQPNFEKIASVQADVLIANSGFEKHVATVEQGKTKVFLSATNSVEDLQKSITTYGQMLGKEDKAKELVTSIDDKLKSVKQEKKVRSLLVYGAPGTYMAALPTSLSGDILEKVGGENIAKDYEATKEFPQYAQLSVERVVESNPEVVYLITHGDPEAVKKAFEEEMKKNAGWKNLDAVKNNKVVILPSHLFGTNPGTKINDAIDFMANSIKEVAK